MLQVGVAHSTWAAITIQYLISSISLFNIGNSRLHNCGLLYKMFSDLNVTIHLRGHS